MENLSKGLKYPALSARENALAQLLEDYYISHPNKWISARSLAWGVNELMDKPYTDLTYTGADIYAGVDRYDFGTIAKDALSYGDFKARIGTQLSEEIHEINQSGALPFLVVSDKHKGYKIANPTELHCFIDKTAREMKKKAIYINGIISRAKQSGQIYFDGKEKPCFIEVTHR